MLAPDVGERHVAYIADERYAVGKGYRHVDADGERRAGGGVDIEFERIGGRCVCLCGAAVPDGRFLQSVSSLAGERCRFGRFGSRGGSGTCDAGGCGEAVLLDRETFTARFGGESRQVGEREGGFVHLGAVGIDDREDGQTERPPFFRTVAGHHREAVPLVRRTEFVRRSAVAFECGSVAEAEFGGERQRELRCDDVGQHHIPLFGYIAVSDRQQVGHDASFGHFCEGYLREYLRVAAGGGIVDFERVFPRHPAERLYVEFGLLEDVISVFVEDGFVSALAPAFEVYLYPVVEIEPRNAVYRILEVRLPLEIERKVVNAVQHRDADGVAGHDRFAYHDFAVGTFVFRYFEREDGIVVVQPVDVAACSQQQREK